MLNTIQRRFALSKVGARNFCQGVLATVLLDIALMLPVIYTFIFLEDYMSTSIGAKGMQQHALPFYLLLGVAFMLVLYLVGLWQYKSTYNSVYDESARRRIDLAEKLRKLPLAFFGEKNLSDLTATIMDDNSDLEHTFSHAVPQLFASLITLLLMATGLFFFQWKLALSLLWVVPVALGVLYIAKRWIYKNDKKNYDNKRKVSEAIQEGLENVQEIKSYNREAHYLNQLGDSIDSYESTLTKSELSTGILVNGAQSLLKLGLATVVIFGAQMVATSEISIFTYILFMVIGAHLYLPIMEVMLNLAALIFLDVRINRMNEMKDLAMQEGKKEFLPQRYDIEFKGVDFAYETGKAVLNDLSFVAKQGEITALIGASGSGKSTVAKLAARFWDINKGKITVGGIDISKIDAEVLLKDFSIVFQDVVLFNASVMDNIRIGKRSATDEEVMRVAKLARCDQFINRLPEGYHTIIGENGETLSGGERQRISIARALLKDAPIVLLDEATASLDIENETLIQSAILELVRRKTVLIIAHRMRTIANADKVVVLKDGQVVEQGNPKDLQKQGRYFSKMIKLQTLEL